MSTLPTLSICAQSETTSVYKKMPPNLGNVYSRTLHPYMKENLTAGTSERPSCTLYHISHPQKMKGSTENVVVRTNGTHHTAIGFNEQADDVPCVMDPVETYVETSRAWEREIVLNEEEKAENLAALEFPPDFLEESGEEEVAGPVLLNLPDLPSRALSTEDLDLDKNLPTGEELECQANRDVLTDIGEPMRECLNTGTARLQADQAPDEQKEECARTREPDRKHSKTSGADVKSKSETANEPISRVRTQLPLVDDIVLLDSEAREEVASEITPAIYCSIPEDPKCSLPDEQPGVQNYHCAEQERIDQSLFDFLTDSQAFDVPCGYKQAKEGDMNPGEDANSYANERQQLQSYPISAINKRNSYDCLVPERVLTHENNCGTESQVKEFHQTGCASNMEEAPPETVQRFCGAPTRKPGNPPCQNPLTSRTAKLCPIHTKRKHEENGIVSKTKKRRRTKASLPQKEKYALQSVISPKFELLPPMVLLDGTLTDHVKACFDLAAGKKTIMQYVNFALSRCTAMKKK